MSRLSEILDQMTVVLNDLKTVMDAEQQHLSSGHINGSALQRITEDKSSLLATLDYLEQQRRAEQDPKRSANDDIIERWQTITEKPSTCATLTSTTAGYWKVRLNVISRRLRY